MFPFHEERIRWDDYGEIIRPEDYMISDVPETEEDKSKAVSLIILPIITCDFNLHNYTS